MNSWNHELFSQKCIEFGEKLYAWSNWTGRLNLCKQKKKQSTVTKWRTDVLIKISLSTSGVLK